VRKLRGHTKQVLLLVGIALVVAVALASSLRSSAQARVSSDSVARGSAVPTDGTPITLSPTANARLAVVGITQSYLLGTHDGRSYYRLVKRDGTLCFGVGAVTNPNSPGSVICLNSETVPPILDFSVYQKGADDPSLSVWRLEGLVTSPDIARVDVIGLDGGVSASVPVVNGVYYKQFASAIPVTAIERIDVNGNVVSKTVLSATPSTSP
jgi:hypothetical protein